MTPKAAASLVALAATFALASAPAQAQDDPRVRAFVEAYRPHIDSVAWRSGDVVFFMDGRAVHFEDGRMLEAGRLDRRESCDPIFYRYPLEPLTEAPVAAEEITTSCRDVPEILWGDTETEIRRHSGGVTFLDHRMFVNDILRAPLAAVERDLEAAARHDPAIAEWIADIDITYSFVTRDVAATGTPSYHAWGLAFDLVPKSYEGRHVYWRWSRALDRQGWRSIPLEERWSPPPPQSRSSSGTGSCGAVSGATSTRSTSSIGRRSSRTIVCSRDGRLCARARSEGSRSPSPASSRSREW